MQMPLSDDVVRNPSGMDASGRDCIPFFGLPLSKARSLQHAFSLVRDLLTAEPAHARLVTFTNPYSVRVASRDETYRSNLERMDLVFCDGIGLALAARYCERFPMERISFDSTSLAPLLFDFAQTSKYSVALVGGRPGVAKVAADLLAGLYPGLSIRGVIDGYRPWNELIDYICRLRPQIVLCGMGAPRQEAFLVALADSGWKGVGFTCGGYFDHLGEGFHYYPKLIDKFNLRWFYRIAREPRRLGYRNVIEYGPFWAALAERLLHRRAPKE
jgi:N-acetylglucosaminyldiphosphoundecaprenol N-acetyl-beta-D-mannosaminyltransferase